MLYLEWSDNFREHLEVTASVLRNLQSMFIKQEKKEGKESADVTIWKNPLGKASWTIGMACETGQVWNKASMQVQYHNDAPVLLLWFKPGISAYLCCYV